MLNNEASREALKKAKRIVIKVGTSTITYANGKRNFSQIDRLAREISDLQNQGKEMILVTSGAVAVGVDRMGLPGKPKTIPGKQAAAAVGQKTGNLPILAVGVAILLQHTRRVVNAVLGFVGL